MDTIEMGRSQMLLHVGGETVERQRVFAASCPPATPTWHPISHATVLQTIERQLPEYGIEVSGQPVYAVGGKDDARFFGLLPVAYKGRQPNNELTLVMGVRNSTDKSFPAGLVIGTYVRICDNLWFHGTVRAQMGDENNAVTRRHTKHVLRDFPRLVGNLLAGYSKLSARVEDDIEGLKALSLDEPSRNRILVESVRHGVIGPQRFSDVIKYIDSPPEGQDMNTGWGVFNAFTASMRGMRPEGVMRESMRMNRIFSALAHGEEVDWTMSNVRQLAEGVEVTDEAMASREAALLAQN
jgi:hypothetical protein